MPRPPGRRSRGYYPDQLVRTMTGMSLLLAACVVGSVLGWAGRATGGPGTAVAWPAYAGAVVLAVVAVVVTVGPVRRSVDAGRRLGLVVLAVALLLAAFALAWVPVRVLPTS